MGEASDRKTRYILQIIRVEDKGLQGTSEDGAEELAGDGRERLSRIGDDNTISLRGDDTGFVLGRTRGNEGTDDSVAG